MNAILGVLTGFAAYAALNHLLVGTRGERPAIHRSMGGFAAAAALYIACSAVLYTTLDLETYRAWMRLQGTAGSLFVAAALWFAVSALGHLEGHRLGRVSRWGMVAAIAGLAVLAVASLLMPGGMFFGEIVSIERVRGPLGPVTVPIATPNPWQPVANVFWFVPAFFALGRAVQVRLRGRRRLAMVTAVALALPLVPALVDTFVYGVAVWTVPATELGVAGGLLFLSAVVTDEVIRSAELERELARSEARYRWLIETAPEAVCVYDPESDRFVLANGPAERLFGRSVEEILASPPELLLAADSERRRERFRSLIERAKAGDRAVEEWAVPGADGAEVPCDLSLAALPSPEGTQVRVSLIDLRPRRREEAERARVEERLRRSERLHTIGTLAEGIAHDFNNLLTPILGYAELAEDELGAHPASEYVSELQGSAERARELVRQILAFDAEHMPGPTTFVLQPIVKQALRFLRAAIPQGIEVDGGLDAPDARIFGDPAQVHQVVMNLGLNAAHAMGDEGRMEVRLKRNGDRVILSVADQGTGMDAETARRIFDPFFTTKAPGRGTGLGLSMVRQVVDGWGGHVDVDSAPGRGTIFRIDIPLATEAADEVPRDRELHRGRESVLVIDDDPAVAVVVSRMLSSLGYRVATYTDPEAALLSLERARFDLCITDFDMPAMNGVEVARRLRQLFPRIPIILMSGLAEGLEEKVDSDGPWWALAKPFDRRGLSGALAAVLPREPRPDTAPATAR